MTRIDIEKKIGSGESFFIWPTESSAPGVVGQSGRDGPMLSLGANRGESPGLARELLMPSRPRQ